MFDTLIPFTSIIGTVLIFVAFVTSALMMIGTVQMKNMRWFFMPLTLALGIALLRSVDNMRNMVNLITEKTKKQKKNVFLTSCPDYWIKDTILVGDISGDISSVNICKNYTLDANGNYQFVGGSGDTFKNNFVPSATDMDDAMKKLNDMHPSTVKDDTVVVDNFVNSIPDVTDKIDPAVHLTGNVHTDSHETEPDNRVSYFSSTEDLNDPTYNNVAIAQLPGAHIHYTGNIQIHNNSDGDPVHDSEQGAVWHSHATNQNHPEKPKVMPSEYHDKWIFETQSDEHKGVEINLDRLNAAGNKVCDLSRNLYWTEAYNKCV
jgi:hypothetical protein